jgi:hypothetical protein
LETIKTTSHENLESRKDDIILTDAYYYGRKYQILEIIHESPFADMTEDILQDNVTGKKNFETLKTVANFYKHRLRCFEEVREDQPIIKAMQLPHFAQPNRMKARYSDQIAKQNDIDFPPLRADKRLNPIFLLPQFCFEYPVSRSMLIGDVTYMPLISRQLVCFLLFNLIKEHVLCVRDFQHQFDLHFIPQLQIQSALTTPAAVCRCVF